jgi:hypothetical protein
VRLLTQLNNRNDFSKERKFDDESDPEDRNQLDDHNFHNKQTVIDDKLCLTARNMR